MRNAKRISGMLSLALGSSICLNNNEKIQWVNEHKEAHKADKLIKPEGNNTSTPKGTITLARVIAISTASVISVKKECKKQILTAVALSFGKVNGNTLVRSTHSFPSAEAKQYIGTILKKP